MVNQSSSFSTKQHITAWSVHFFTASGAVFGLFALYAIHQYQFRLAFWLMAATVFIDSVDGVMARRAKVKLVLPNIDGALLDNIIDYQNYVIVPAFFLLISDLLPPTWSFISSSVIMLASAYQFVQCDAKTADHFFKGFPSYWNIVVFYLFFWQFSTWVNLAIILSLAIFVFVPIKYIYPSRMDYLTPKRRWRRLMLAGAILWSMATAGLLWTYPAVNPLFVTISMGYMIIYFLFSLYRTLR